MAKSRKLEIVIGGDASGGLRALGQIESRTGRTGKSFSRFGRMASLGIGAVAVAGAAAVVAVGRDLMNMERLNAQTETAIRSTGGAANVSLKDIQNFSQGMQDLTGIQQETVIEGQNLLLTFTNVRNEVGEGNDIFNQASTAMADMSVAMGTDMSSAAMLVGKALNDPIKGMGALSRAGVQFTQQQKDQIAAMVESGDTMGAQRIILGELQTQFGGSAAAFGETTAGQFARIKEGVMDAVEGLVVQLMPAVTQVASWFRTVAMPAVQAFAQEVGPKLQAAFAVVVAWVQANWPAIQTTITNVMTQIRGVIQAVIGFVQAAWATFGDTIMGHVRRTWPIIQQIIKGAMQVIRGVITTVTGLIKGDWGQVWNGIVSILRGVLNVAMGLVRNSMNIMRSIISAAWAVIRNLTSSAWNGIKNLVRSGVDAVVGFIRGLPGRIASFASGAFDALKDAFRNAINFIIRGWNGLEFSIPGFDPPGPGPSFGGFTLGVPDLPQLARGGVIKGSGSVMVGERGPEILSLPRGAQVTPLGGGGVVNFNFYGPVSNEAQVIAWVEGALRKGVPTPGLDRKIRRAG